ncbi:hypothetical protein [Methanospirillum hungatei]|nr:hypothetical protein [Methanospirillum hungatei]
MSISISTSLKHCRRKTGLGIGRVKFRCGQERRIGGHETLS